MARSTVLRPETPDTIDASEDGRRTALVVVRARRPEGSRTSESEVLKAVST